MLTTIRRTLLIGIPISMAIIFGSWLNHQQAQPVRSATIPAVTKITEDDPRWDCHTMGNHTCGSPTTVDIAEAEHDASAALTDMIPTCQARGMSAEAWAEVNSTQPSGYEVIAECVHLTPTH